MNPKEKRKAKRMYKLFTWLTFASLIIFIIGVILIISFRAPMLIAGLSAITLISSMLTLFAVYVYYEQKIKLYHNYIHKWRNYNAYLHCIELIKNEEYDEAIALSGTNLWLYPNLQHLIIGMVCKGHSELFTRVINKTMENYYPGEFKN